MFARERSRPVLPIAIVADDLTGCCDAAAPFAAPGTAVSVFCSPTANPRSDAGVVACCTASRADAAAEAALKVEAVCRRLVGRAPARWFKKIDSTLHGNLGAEVETMLHHSSANVAVICPALPAEGRWLERGYLRVTGDRALEVHLPSVLSSQSNLPMKHFTVEDTAQMVATSSWEISSTARPAFWVFDAATSHDLGQVATIVARLGSAALAVGSSGLAHELTSRWLPFPHSAIHSDTRIVQAGDLFAVIGTKNKVTAQQLAHLQKWSGCMFVDVYDSDAAVGLDNSGTPVVFRHVWNTQGDRSLATFLGQLAARKTGTLLMSGGDTAQRCCRLTNTEEIAIHGELEAGVPCGRVRDGKLKGWQIVTKAGGFGTAETLCRVWARLQPPSSPVSLSLPPHNQVQGTLKMTMVQGHLIQTISSSRRRGISR